MLAKAKRLDFSYSIAENCCKVNDSEDKKDVFHLVNVLAVGPIVGTDPFILLCA